MKDEKWFHNENMTDKVDIIKRHISLLDEELKEKFDIDIDYGTEDKLLDAVYDVLKDKRLI